MTRYCPLCLDRDEHRPDAACLSVPAETVRQRAARALAYRDYLPRYGAVWLILDDDPDNWQDRRVADWPADGDWVELVRLLQAHGWPTGPALLCLTCGENPVGDLGESCVYCREEHALWDAAERMADAL